MVGGEPPGRGHVHLRVAGLADEPAGDGGGRSRREHPVDPVEDVVGAPLRATRGPGEAGVGDRVRVHRAVGVDEAGVRERRAGRPADGVGHVRPGVRDGRGPVEVRGAVEVAGEEDRDPARGQPRQHPQHVAQRGDPQPLLERQHLRLRLPALHLVGAVRRRRQVRVRHRHDPARHRLDVRVEPLPARGPQDREAGDHLRAGVRVPAEQPGQGPGVALGLLEADHVGAAGADDAGQLAQACRAAVGDRAPVAGGQVVVVAAVEDVQAQHRDGGAGGLRLRRLRAGAAAEAEIGARPSARASTRADQRGCGTTRP